MKHTYSKEQKNNIRGMVEALEGARPLLAPAVRAGGGICRAIESWYRSTSGGDYYWKAKMDAQRLISRALGPHSYLTRWQFAHGLPVTIGEDSLPIRSRWLDQLIADCKAALEE